MANYNPNILIENIKMLMENNKVKQEELAEYLGMSQPNVSKALNKTNKKSFTLDQVVGIAKRFNVSVDMLVGNLKKEEPKLSPRFIAGFLSSLIASKDAKYFTYEKEELIYEPDDTYGYLQQTYSPKKTKISYPAIYLPSYLTLLCDYDVIDAQQCGNATRMIPVNNFLKQFNDIWKIYRKGDLPEETYDVVVSDFLKNVPEK